MRSRVAPLAVLALLAPPACSSAATSPPPATPSASAPAEIVAGCSANGGWQSIPGARVDAAQRGSGRTVVFANDSGNSPCDWLPLANTLSDHGYRTVVFTYSTIGADSEDQALHELLDIADLARGTDSYALVGASVGGRLVLEAAATHPRQLRCIVSLSGERTVQAYRDILSDARRVTVPLLYVGARDDPYTDGTRQPTLLHAAVRGKPNELLLLDGSSHGADLLDQPVSDGRTTADRIVVFVTTHLRS